MPVSKGYYVKVLKDLWIALRPFSLTLALASITLGLLVTHLEGKLLSGDLRLDIFKMALIYVGAILSQSCANLINDFYEGSFKYHRHGEKTYKFLKYERTGFDLLVLALSMLCLVGFFAIGYVLVQYSTPNLYYIGIAGMIGSYAYTGEPFVYKRKGLGALLSFILMGPLMVLGTYMVFTSEVSLEPIILTTPAALMIPLLMLSNEIRDYDRDKDLGIRTLTVIIGEKAGRALFISLMVIAYSMTALLVLTGSMPTVTLLVFLTLPIAIRACKKVALPKTSGIRITNWLHIAFNCTTILALIIS
ncbi:prenyltransferase [Niallia sp. XMNu-256]|uniref:prenyltransferase n=1 Tax=Niallia sp. XMNu-256 TaxID=3082444 RepID=UPI0030D19352